ncbi:hypothetical protein RWK44_34300 [Rhizobium sp. 25PS6]|uniref:hypothetical protein n=1 Tax=Rhizobium sp. 25PS6 TaxID=3075622 RepID=UPI0028FDA0C3|nr:hypothetical protein [Rhizobium sp. 25PS6]MDU0365437.1 hypothetical protein [Rhizobium sp. 25PS6]
MQFQEIEFTQQRDQAKLIERSGPADGGFDLPAIGNAVDLPNDLSPHTVEFHMIAIGELIKYPAHHPRSKPQSRACATTTANVPGT